MMNRRTLVALLVAFAASCAAKEAARDSSPAEASTGELTELEDDKERSDDLDRSERRVAGVDDLVRKLNEFAFDLYRSTRTEQFVISPVGVANLLSVAQAGAEGASAEQIGQSPGRHLGDDNGCRPDTVEHGELFDGEPVIEKENGEDRIIKP